MNINESTLTLDAARVRVLGIQTKLHRWARNDRCEKFDDLFNLVTDSAFLLVAWDRVRSNKGSETAGVDGVTAARIVTEQGGVVEFLGGLRSALKDRSFRPLPVRERMIPKPNGKLRRLGITTIADRVVQGSLKLVLEPIFEADFSPYSYGFRPNRRTHDAVAEVRYLASRPRSYEWVVEGDITACFDEISHPALMDRVRARIADGRVLALVKAFLKSGILGEDRQLRETTAGTPQGSILSPLLSNVALSVLDEHFAHRPGGATSSKDDRHRRRKKGLPNVRLVRYADDWCLMVKGTFADAQVLRQEAADVLVPMGLRLSEAKTLITHIDEGLDFLGWRIQRHRKKGTSRYYVYVYPARKAVKAVCRKIKAWCRTIAVNQPLDVLIAKINPVLRGWCSYFRKGVSSAVFSYLNHYVWQTVWAWIRRKHRKSNWKTLRRQYADGGWWPHGQEQDLFDPQTVTTNWYRYRGSIIPSPWPNAA